MFERTQLHLIQFGLMVLAISSVAGINHGLAADSPADAKIVRGEDYNLSEWNNSSEYRPDTTYTSIEQATANATGLETGQEEPPPEAMQTFVDGVVIQTMHVASLFAIGTYYVPFAGEWLAAVVTLPLTSALLWTFRRHLRFVMSPGETA